MRRFSSLQNRRHLGSAATDVSPMEGVANLVDVMLVFACGLMLAIMINWSVDLTVVIDRDKLREVEAEEIEQDENSLSASRFMDMGSAYMDPETGKVYIFATTDSE